MYNVGEGLEWVVIASETKQSPIIIMIYQLYSAVIDPNTN
jgi:hypothetical protein